MAVSVCRSGKLVARETCNLCRSAKSADHAYWSAEFVMIAHDDPSGVGPLSRFGRLARAGSALLRYVPPSFPPCKGGMSESTLASMSESALAWMSESTLAWDVGSGLARRYWSSCLGGECGDNGAMGFAPIDEQLAVLARGCERIDTLDELRAKLTASREADRPLRIKLGLDNTWPLEAS